ncbi:hypothetical protein ACWEP4_21350 [Streptomyces sp. NPDC004227]
MSALAALGDPTAIPQLTEAVSTAVRHEQWRTATSALEALASFGTRAAPALEVVRPLTNAEDVDLRACHGRCVGARTRPGRRRALAGRPTRQLPASRGGRCPRPDRPGGQGRAAAPAADAGRGIRVAPRLRSGGAVGYRRRGRGRSMWSCRHF